MRLSANLINSFNSVNSFTFSNWSIRANEPNILYFQLVDLDQMAWVNPNQTIWPNVIQQSSNQMALRYLTGITASPVVVSVIFPTLDCNSSPLTIVATPVSASDTSLFSVSLTSLQVPGSGNVIFSVQEGSVTRKFFVQSGISVENPLSTGQC